MKFGQQPVRVFAGEAGVVAQIFPEFRQRDVRIARAAQHLRVAEFELDQHLSRRLGEFRQGELVRDGLRHQAALGAGLREELHIEKCPGTVGAQAALGPQLSLLAAGQGPDDMRIHHLGGGSIVFAELPDPLRPLIGKTGAFENGLRFQIGFILSMPGENFPGPFLAARHDEFVQHQINSAGGEADAKIRHAQSPDADACRAQCGELVMAGVLCQRNEQREQERDGQREDKKGWQLGGGEFQRVEKMQIGLAHFVEPGEEKKRNPENHEPAQAAGQRREQFAEKVSVVQPHGAG